MQSPSDPNAGPIPEGNYTDTNTGPIPEDNSTSSSLDTGLDNMTSADNSTGMGTIPVDNSPGTGENMTNSVPENNTQQTTQTPSNTYAGPPPLEQVKSGVQPKDVQCKKGFTLILKADDGSAACVDPQVAQILIQRGW